MQAFYKHLCWVVNSWWLYWKTVCMGGPRGQWVSDQSVLETLYWEVGGKGGFGNFSRACHWWWRGDNTLMCALSQITRRQFDIFLWVYRSWNPERLTLITVAIYAGKPAHATQIRSDYQMPEVCARVCFPQSSRADFHRCRPSKK